MSWDKDGLIEGVKTVYERKQHKNSLMTPYEQAAIQPSPEKKGSITPNILLFLF